MGYFSRAMSAAVDIKTEGASRLARQRRIVCEHTALMIESSPARALALGRDNVERSASSFAGKWKELLSREAVCEICALLRDTGDGTEQMRISQPFAGLLPAGELGRISREVYGTRPPWNSDQSGDASQGG